MRVGVLGAGMGGLAVAALLKRSGHDVSIIERYSKPHAVGAGLLLQPPGQNVLQKLGLLAELKAQSSVITRLESLTSRGKPILDVRYDADRDDTSADFGLGVHRPILHRLLLDAAVASGCDVQNSRIAVAAENTAAGVRVVCDNGVEHFDFLIIATGAQSDWLEDSSPSKRFIKPYRWGCLWANVEWPTGLLEPHVLHQRCLKTQKMMGLLPTTSNNGVTKQAALYWSIDLNEWQGDGFERYRQQMIELWPETTAVLEEATANDFQLARYYDVWCSNPVSGNMAVIGDAAHGTSPQLGQGVTMALLDAEALAYVLGQLRPDQPDFSSSVSRFYAHRRLMHQRYVRHASKVLTPFFQSRSKVLGLIRDNLFAATLAMPPLKRVAQRTLSSSFCCRQ